MSIKSDVKLPECVCVCSLASKRIRNAKQHHEFTNKQTDGRLDGYRTHVCPFRNPTNRILIKQSKLIPSIERDTRTVNTHTHRQTRWWTTVFGVPFCRPPSNINTLYSLLSCWCCFHFAWTAQKMCTLRRTYTHTHTHDKLTFYLDPFKFMLYPAFQPARRTTADANRDVDVWSGWVGVSGWSETCKPILWYFHR